MQKAVLIAEDSENDAMAIHATLRDAGVTLPLKFVADGSSVIAYLKGAGEYADREKFPLPSVLLMDLRMPFLDGFQVMEWLKTQKRFHDLLIVALSGHGELSNVREAHFFGARSFLTKPCRMVDVKNLMRTYSTYFEPDSTSGTAVTPTTPPTIETGYTVSPDKNSRVHL